MNGVAPTTGPSADKAFRIGLIVVTVAAASVIAGGYVAGALSGVGAIAAALIGYPIAVLCASCVLGIWLGYAEEARYKGAKYALEHNKPDK